MVANPRSPSIHLTDQDLRAIASVRLSKQYNKRFILIVVPALVMAIAGMALVGAAKPIVQQTGYVLVAVAMAGFLGGIVVVSRWLERAKVAFAKEHEGAFWKRS